MGTGVQIESNGPGEYRVLLYRRSPSGHVGFLLALINAEHMRAAVRLTMLAGQTESGNVLISHDAALYCGAKLSVQLSQAGHLVWVSSQAYFQLSHW